MPKASGVGMSVLTYGADAVKRAGKRVLDLVSDTSGVAALEFALIAPLLLSMYFVTIEVGQGIETNKKVGRVASTVADLVTQQQTTTTADLKVIMEIGKAILMPYGRSDPTIVITAIEITDEETPKVKVAWSRKRVGAAEPTADPDQPAGTITTVPDKLKIKGTFLVRVTATLDYKPVITWVTGQEAADQQDAAGLGVMDKIFDSNGALKMNETYYLRPRMSQTIPCSNC